MHTRGRLDPESIEEAREWYETAGVAAQTTVREVARAMDFDGTEYDERVTGEVVETARDAVFASLLSVTVADREEYDRWRASHEGDVAEAGHPNVDHVAWHVGPDGDAVAATFQREENAAIATLRRQAFGRLYREQLRETDVTD